jgi:hypothetical protein
LGQCPNKFRCQKCKAKHNTALHDAWEEKKSAVTLLTKNISPISLLTTAIMKGSNMTSLKKKTNAIYDNGASISLMSKEIADAIGLRGETRRLGLSVIGDSNLIQQAFKASVNIYDVQENKVGKARVHVISSFVDLIAVDWSTQAVKFPHLTSINFPRPFSGGQCGILLGNDNHHLTTSVQLPIRAQENAQAFPYASLTPLRWCAAGPTMPPSKNDQVMNLLVKSATKRYHEEYKVRLRKEQSEAEQSKE